MSEKTMINTNPSQKLGMDTAISPVETKTLSRKEYCLTAEIIPIGNPMTIIMNIQHSASSIVTGYRSNSVLTTGSPVE